MKYLIFETNYTETTSPAIGDGSYLKLIPCQEGWFLPIQFKALVDSFNWQYTEAESITRIEE